MKNPLLVCPDIGRSNVKLTYGVPGEEPQLSLFPSIAAPVDAINRTCTHGDDSMDSFVEVDGSLWAAIDAWSDANSLSRDSTRSFPLSGLHDALLKISLIRSGAAGRDVILILGHAVREAGLVPELMRRYAGNLRLNQYQACNIVDVAAIPQPMGSIYEAMVQGVLPMKPDEMDAGELICLIDGGSYSVDWIVLNHNYRQIESASWSSGIAIRTLIDNLVQESEKRDFRISSATIETALNRGQGDFGSSKALRRIAPHVEAHATALANQIFGEMSSRLASCDSDISRVILSGGGAALFGDQLAARFRSQGADIVRLNDSQLANARGFFAYGSLRYRRMMNVA